MNCSRRGCMGHKIYTKSLELLVVVKVKLRILNRGKGHEFGYKQDENHAQLQYSHKYKNHLLGPFLDLIETICCIVTVRTETTTSCGNI